jgi:hypothetical protein
MWISTMGSSCLEAKLLRLFHEAGIRWKKTQKRNPKKDPDLVEKKNKKSPIGSTRIGRNWSVAS